MKNLKKTTLLLTLVLTFALIVPLLAPFQNNVTTTQAASDKSKITSTVNNYFNAAKSLNLKKMNKYSYGTFESDGDNLELVSYIPSLNKYIKTRNKSMSFNIKKIKVKGKSATVTVKCKYMDSSDTLATVLLDFVNTVNENDSQGYSDIELFNIYNSAIKESLKGVDDAYGKTYVTKTFKIELTKQKGTWKINKNNYDLSNVVTSNYFETIKLFSELD